MLAGPDDIARRVAQRLSGDMGRKLPAIVEAELQARATADIGPSCNSAQSYEPIAIAISLAALLVTAAKAAWEVYRDVVSDSREKPLPEIVERRLRIELKIGENVSVEQRDRIIAAVVAEAATSASSSR